MNVDVIAAPAALARASAEPPAIARVGVIGAGQMGNGIAHVAALAGHLGLVGAPASRFAELLRSVYAGEGVLQQVLGVPDDQVDQEIHAITRRVARFASTPATL